MKRSTHKSKSPRQSSSKNPPKQADGSGDEAAHSPASRRKWLFRLIAMVLIPCVLMSAAEIILRLGGYGHSTHLFKPLQIGGQKFLVNNDTFAFRFFPAQLARFPGPVRMGAQKPPDTYRIFILGESAAMGDPEPAFGAGRYLEALLSARYPKTHFEIVNLGITAINSHVILPIARDCAKADGDLWIIYMGNNEMVGPFGAATVFGAKAPPLPLIRLNLAIQKARLGQLLVNLGRKLKGASSNAPSWSGMEMFVGNRLTVDDPRKEAVYQNFSQNLDEIVTTGLKSGAKILLNTVAVNLKDCAPFASLVNSNLPAADRGQYDQFYAGGMEARNRGDFSGAAQQFEAAARLDPTVAELQFQWGECLLRLTNDAAAHEHLQQACDDDALPFRADSRINAIIRNEPKKTGDGNLVLFDADATLAAETPESICGEETFFEHVHFNFEGNYRLGRAWAGQVAAMLPGTITNQAVGAWATEDECDRRLGLSDWNRALVMESMAGRLQQPPLSSQSNNAKRLSTLEERADQLRSHMDAVAVARARGDFQGALAQAPDDYYVHENFALFLQSTGDLPGAAAECRRVLELIPQDCVAYFQLGRVLEIQSRFAGAESAFRQAVALRPSLTEGWIQLGDVLASEEKFEAALASYSTALEQRPKDAQTILRRGKVLARMGDHAGAIAAYRQAAGMDPNYWEAPYELGGELDSKNQLAEACSEFATAVRLNPGNSRAHFNYGVLLAKQGRLAEAQQEFSETLRLEPGYNNAKVALMKVEQMKKVGRTN